jgi:hypothetical protein
MIIRKKLSVLIMILVVVALGIAASTPPPPEHKNLKILPKNISHDDLDKIMDEWKAALGVKCNFCHAPQKDNPRKLDFASDEKPDKKITRDMFRMTEKINKKYFNFKKGDTTAIAPVGCVTCHHGQPHPDDSK